MRNAKLSIGRILVFSFALLAMWIGAGFSTGQEILQFFVAWGSGMPICLITVTVMCGWAFLSYSYVGRHTVIEKNEDIFIHYCGKWIGKAFNVFVVIFCYAIFIYMVAAAGSTGEQQFGLPLWVGVVGMGVFVTACATLGLKRLVEILGRLGGFIICMIFFVVFVNLALNYSNIPEYWNAVCEDYTQFDGLQRNLASGPVMAGVAYIGGTVAYMSVFIAQLVHNAGDRQREARISVIVGTIFVGAALTIYSISMLANLEVVSPMSIPSLILASDIWGPLGYIYSFAVWAAIFTTSSPLLWTACTWIAPEGTVKYKLATIILGVLGVVIALFIPYKTLINYILSIGGYIILVFWIIMVIHDILLFIKNRTNKATPPTKVE